MTSATSGLAGEAFSPGEPDGSPQAARQTASAGKAHRTEMGRNRRFMRTQALRKDRPDDKRKFRPHMGWFSRMRGETRAASGFGSTSSSGIARGCLDGSAVTPRSTFSIPGGAEELWRTAFSEECGIREVMGRMPMPRVAQGNRGPMTGNLRRCRHSTTAQQAKTITASAKSRPPSP